MLVNDVRNLIQLIRGYLGKDCNLQEVNWINVFNVSKAHNVPTIFHEAIKDRDDLPEGYLDIVKKQTFAVINQQIQQEYYLDKLFEELEKQKIKYLPLKGYIMRKIYPRPDLRISCDADVFYEVEKTDLVTPIMEGLGFHLDHEWMNGVVRIEMHKKLFEEIFTANNEYYKDVWQRLLLESGSKYKFTDEDYYVYFIAHASKHFSSSGFGIRTILDIYYYNNAKKLNREYVEQELEKLGILKFTKYLEKISRIWFGDEKSDADTQIIETYIMESGAYGIKKHNVLMNAQDKNNSNKNAKVRYFFKNIFPSLKHMKTAYPVLRKAPILLPFVWVYRGGKVLFTKRDRIKDLSQGMAQINSKDTKNIQDILRITDFPDYKH